ncbi:3-oxoacyl-[acyl-carrier protein] reductase [Pilibacter termitis]|uniref:3-oxoacyl-[acyl-carrier protein] reductase n=1 Tax=Pilibacter termitis TaxID=263852 RepID=A0A1T4M453_9ENTE|nr:SDR family oxidoreductase [Pilibacter termitis]SJZ61712.1 3-oxoacyl-[acyl-carrier protein] reductase [Pilibacter termitis]
MKTALVMGASGDIGSAIVRKFAHQGYSVVLHYRRNEKKVLKIIEEVQKKYPKQDFFMVCLDMCNEEEIAGFLSHLFQVDVLVFASGCTHYNLLQNVTSDQMNELWQVHLKTPMLLCQKLEDKLAQNGSGRIVFIGSIYGSKGSAMETVYSAMKAGQSGFAKSYAKEIASRNITVNVVAAGAVATKMNEEFTEEEIHELKMEIPKGRLAKAEEIASLVYFLTTDDAEYITGATLDINGGW